MNAGLGNLDSGPGANAAGIDLRAIDLLGVRRPFSDLEVARAELRRWGG